MLPVLAALQFCSAWLVRRLALRNRRQRASRPIATTSASARPARSALRVVAEAPYLRNLAALVLLGTTGAALVDYLFKAQAVETFGRGDNLLRFFALYYAGDEPAHVRPADVVEPRLMLERFGLAVTDEHAVAAPCWPAASAASSRRASAA